MKYVSTLALSSQYQMKLTGVISILLLVSFMGFSQSPIKFNPEHRKGKLFFYWGWNRAWYGKSDIKFEGTNYNFILKKVVAKDRQSPFKVDTYLNPVNATIPQFSFRIGYFIQDKYNISFGLDHMKYVVQKNQTVKISGEIQDTYSIYDGNYSNDDVFIVNDFLSFEHTDGLNYINLGFRRFDEFFTRKNFSISVTEGIEVGALFPKTNVILLDGKGYDDFHVSGYGFNAIVGLNLSFYKFFFVQSELKGGYIDMPGIKISYLNSEGASQKFFFSQLNIVFGASINLRRKQVKIKPNNLGME